MGNFWEKVKDILYDSTDYIIMIVTILIVVAIINWRVGGLFKKTNIHNAERDPVHTIDEAEENEESKHENNESEVNGDENEDKDIGDVDDTPSIITVNIPAGSLPGQIGDILESKGLVESKEEFVDKTMEMQMDTKLKSGYFEIPDNSTMEEIINIISK